MAEVELPNPEELEERRDKAFSRRVALVTAVYAVVLAIASLGGNNAMKEMLVAQQQSSNQWAYYQSKVIREHLNRGNKLVLEAQLAEPSTLKGAEREKFERAGQEVRRRREAQEHRQEGDRAQGASVRGQRDLNQAKDPYFDYAEVLLQIAIVCASVSILSTSRPMFWFSSALALFGVLFTLNGFLLLFRIPFLHGH